MENIEKAITALESAIIDMQYKVDANISNDAILDLEGLEIALTILKRG